MLTSVPSLKSIQHILLKLLCGEKKVQLCSKSLTSDLMISESITIYYLLGIYMNTKIDVYEAKGSQNTEQAVFICLEYM